MGRAIYVKIVDLKPNSHILPADMERACGTRIKKEDILIIDSPYWNGAIY